MSAITLTVKEVWKAAELIRMVTLVAPDGGSLPPYEAGAHAEVHLPDGATRPYSLIDFDGAAKEPKAYVFGIRLEDESRGGSRFMHGLAEGDTVTVEPAKNDFPLAEDDAPSVLIAGGIGITPMISMATALKAEGRDYRLHYAIRDESAAAFIEQLTQNHGDCLSVHCDDQAGGPLDIAKVLSDANPEAHIYVCGPKPMIEAVKSKAESAGYPAERVHFELFDAAADQDGDSAFEVEVASTGAVYTIPPGKTIIDVLEEAGEDLIYDCQRGDCGICQTDVLEGTPDHRDVVLSQAERDSGKVMQICVSRAKSARLKLDI